MWLVGGMRTRGGGGSYCKAWSATVDKDTIQSPCRLSAMLLSQAVFCGWLAMNM